MQKLQFGHVIQPKALPPYLQNTTLTDTATVHIGKSTEYHHLGF
jgi:hypothetical protein